DRVAGAVTDNEPSARQPVEGCARLRAIDRADHNKSRAPGGRRERSGEDPGVLIVAREDPERVGTGRLERARIGEELSDLAAEPQLRPDLHAKPMQATAQHPAVPPPQATP